MHGVNNRLLSLDLTKETHRVEDLSEELHRQYLGGYGLGAALLLERMDPAADALGPDNILGFAAGILTGTGAYIASRFMAFAKSPSTGGWGDSNCGAYFGKALKSSGFDAVLISGGRGEAGVPAAAPGNVRGAAGCRPVGAGHLRNRGYP